MNALPWPDEQPLLTVDEVCAALPLWKPRSLYRAIAAGDVPSISFGRQHFVPTAALRQLLGLPTHQMKETG